MSGELIPLGLPGIPGHQGPEAPRPPAMSADAPGTGDNYESLPPPPPPNNDPPDDNERSQDDDDKGGCYIATVTLNSGGSEAQLHFLRKWRDEVLVKSEFGRQLEAFYDLTGPVVANRAGRNMVLAGTFLYPFVLPAVWLAQQRMRNSLLAPLCSVLLYIIFLVGLFYGAIVYFCCRNQRQY